MFCAPLCLIKKFCLIPLTTLSRQKGCRLSQKVSQELFAIKEKPTQKQRNNPKRLFLAYPSCFDVVPLIGLASLEPPDKMSTGHFSPTGKFASKFSPNSSPIRQVGIKNNLAPKGTRLFLVPLIGLEPIRYHYHRILSPARLPISPQRQKVFIICCF